MILERNPEQHALRDAVTRLLRAEYPDVVTRLEAVRSPRAHSARVWAHLADLGVLSLPFSDADGGSGGSFTDLAVAVEALGAAIAPEPVAEVVGVAGMLIGEHATSAQRELLLTDLTTGQSLTLLLAREPGGDPWNTTPATRAVRTGGSWSLTGVKGPTAWVPGTTSLIVSADVAGSIGLFLVDPAAVQVEVHRSIDGRPSARIHLTGTSAVRLGEGGQDGGEALSRACQRERVLLCCEAVGIMDAILGLTVKYLETREQFGRRIGSFQALAFAAADTYVEVELSRSMTSWASLVQSESNEPDELQLSSLHCAAQVTRSARAVGKAGIQLHGGIGLTAEYLVGHMSARLLAIEQQIGDAGYYADLLTAAAKEGRYVDLLR